MKLTDKQYLVALYAYPSFGPARLTLLINFFKSAKSVWETTPRQLKEVGLTDKIVDGFVAFREEFDIREYFDELNKRKINFVTKEDEDYPKSLVELSNAPLVIYYMGDIKILGNPCVAIVGTRKMTGYGKEVAQNFSETLANAGVVVVSGLARGIDTTAHKGALNVSGLTAGVIGSGFGKIYPPENLQLAREIIKNKGVLLSEYRLDYPAIPVNFANRNRIISGLSSAVVVVEGAQKSGTLLTATHAAEQGKTVFAVPGQITSPMSAAPHYLIQNGVKIAFGPEDILTELDVELKVNSQKIKKVLPESKEEKLILETLENEPLGVDEIVRRTKLNTDEVVSMLTMMELKGMVISTNEIFKKVA